MSSYLKENLKEISKLHYIRRAGAIDYWFDFTQNKLQKYIYKSGVKFCLILYSSSEEDDAYIMPFSHIQHLFKEEFLDERGRWMGSISNNLLKIRKSNQTMSIAEYYNAFEFLYDEVDEHDSVLREPEILYDVGEELLLSDLTGRIQMFNETFRNASPQKQKRISEFISRPNAISDYLKKYRRFNCQICGEKGFRQKNGSYYIETHHIIELHKLIPSSLCSDNILVVCANCHRKLHYASVEYKINNERVVLVRINGEEYLFERNSISNSR